MSIVSSSESKSGPRVNPESVKAIFEKSGMAQTASGRFVDLTDVRGWNDRGVSRNVFDAAIREGQKAPALTV